MVASSSSWSLSSCSCGPWLWGPKLDLSLFGGSAALALSLVLVAELSGLSFAPFPEWGWLLLVLCVDVAHVYSTLFRTYLDGPELKAHPLRYFGLPALLYVALIVLYACGPAAFWRVFAYVALFHFIRQQVGWVAVYRTRAGQRGRFQRLLDEATCYTAMLYPVLHWHAHLESTRFAWFVKGDFIDLAKLAEASLPAAKSLWAGLLIAFFLWHGVLFVRDRVLQLGKIVVVGTTAAVWYVGIVATNSDFSFTVTNVIVHGVPYFGLLWAYARERRRDVPESLGSRIAAAGVGAFLGLLLVLAFLEEMAWDRLVWHERAWLFGSSSIELSPALLLFVVPLLALPQATHYVLDGMLWRRHDTRRLAAQRRALGFTAPFINLMKGQNS